MLITGIITCSAKGEFSIVKLANELLRGEGEEEDKYAAEEDFADQCKVQKRQGKPFAFMHRLHRFEDCIRRKKETRSISQYVGNEIVKLTIVLIEVGNFIVIISSTAYVLRCIDCIDLKIVYVGRKKRET
jgi:hypothetical protein